MKITEIYENKIKTAIDECINRGAPLSENVFRVGSDAYFEVFKLARNLVESGYIKVDDNSYEMLMHTDIGETVTLKNGDVIPLDCPLVEEVSLKTESEHSDRAGQIAADSVRGSTFSSKDDLESALSDALPDFPDKDYDRGKAVERAMEILYGELDDMISEAEYKGKDVQLNKPKRGGPKKYYVYVKNPKTGNIKKINFGDAGGLTAKINDPDAVRSFVARHDCKNKNDKTKAGYWACRLPRYGKSLGLKGGGAWW